MLLRRLGQQWWQDSADEGVVAVNRPGIVGGSIDDVWMDGERL